MSDSPEAWERQAGETDKAFEAFCVYRDLGPARSLLQVGQILSKTKGTLDPWSQKNRWVARASKWDDEADRLQRERDQIARRLAADKAQDDALALSRAMKSIAAKGFRQFEQETDGLRKGRKIDSLSAADLARYAEIGIRIDRETRLGSQDRMDEREARIWVEKHVNLTLSYLPEDRHEAYLADLDALIGTGSMTTR